MGEQYVNICTYKQENLGGDIWERFYFNHLHGLFIFTICIAQGLFILTICICQFQIPKSTLIVALYLVLNHNSAQNKYLPKFFKIMVIFFPHDMSCVILLVKDKYFTLQSIIDYKNFIRMLPKKKI